MNKRRLLIATCLSASACCGALARAMDDPTPAKGAPVAPASSEPKGKAPAADLPAAKAVFEKYIEAIGGREKLKAVQTRVVKMTLEMPAQGMKGTVQMYQEAPAKAFTETKIENVGEFKQGSDGDTVWESNQMMGTRLITGKEKSLYLRNLRFNADYDYENQYKEMTTTGVEKFGDSTAYVVELKTPDDMKETRLFDKDTGLLVGLRMTAQTQMGEMANETSFTDYRSVSGIKMPFKQKVKMAGAEMSTTVESAELGVKIPEEKFALPQDVKDLLEKQKTSPGDPAKPADAPKPGDSAKPGNEKK
jgi:hypothetical protein